MEIQSVGANSLQLEFYKLEWPSEKNGKVRDERHRNIKKTKSQYINDIKFNTNYFTKIAKSVLFYLRHIEKLVRIWYENLDNPSIKIQNHFFNHNLLINLSNTFTKCVKVFVFSWDFILLKISMILGTSLPSTMILKDLLVYKYMCLGIIRGFWRGLNLL